MLDSLLWITELKHLRHTVVECGLELAGLAVGIEMGKRRLVALCRRPPGIGPFCRFPRPHEPGDCPLVSCPFEVIGDRIGIGTWHRREHLTGALMPVPPPGRRHPLVERLTDQRVDEADSHAL